MKPEIKNEWIKALRSGDYKQTRRSLRTPEGFCCLGVFCDIAIKSGEVKNSEGELLKWEGATLPYFRIGMESNYIPAAIREWADIIESPIVEQENGETDYLTNINDRGELSFSDIADLIEKDQTI